MAIKTETQAAERIPRGAGCRSYITGPRIIDEARLRMAGRKQTGIRKLDDVIGGGLEPSLTAIIGGTSVGKTTFCLQLAYSMARAGHDVYYFAYEQGRHELTAKLAAHAYNMQRPGAALTMADIRWGTRPTEAEAAYQTLLTDVGDRLMLLDRSYAKDGAGIKDMVLEYIKQAGRPPVVFVDYLQLLDAPEEKAMTERQIVDSNLSHLVDLAKDHLVPVIAISSVSAAAARGPLDVYSGKESAGIGYGAANVWTLELAATLTPEFASSKLEDQLAILEAAKAESPRVVALTVQKGRGFGKGYGAGEVIRLKYHPAEERYECPTEFVRSTVDYYALSTQGKKEAAKQRREKKS